MGGKRKATTTMSNGNPPEHLDKDNFYGMQLDDEQYEFAEAIWNKDIDIVFVDSKAGTGKAQPVDTIIPTPNGRMALGDLTVGDYVFDRLGNPTKVLGVFDQGMQDAYKVTLADGRETICAGEHLWTYFGYSTDFVTETLNSMMQRSIDTGKSGCRYIIPNNKAVKYDTKELPVDPYAVGVFIGNGCGTEKILTISSNDEEVVANFSRLIGASEYVKNSDKNYSWSFMLQEDAKRLDTSHRRKKYHASEVFADIPELIGDSYSKRIPSIYLMGDENQRLALLQGLMDTDGCATKSLTGNNMDKYSISYSTVNKGLMEDITDLIRGLGFKCSVVLDRRDKYRNGVCYNIVIQASNKDKEHFFRLERKKNIGQAAASVENTRKYDRVGIKKIEALTEKKHMVCIYVDNPEHLYLTNDYIVTHNTTVAMGVANLLVQYGRFKEIVYVMSPYGERKQGYLPGDLDQKSSVYFEPCYQALITCGVNPFTALTSDIDNQKNGSAYVTCITDTFLRGQNLDDAVIIIDEAQNFTTQQLKKVLTRIGSRSKVIVIGHRLQCDLEDPIQSGFSKYIEHFRDEKRAAVCKLTSNHRGWISQHADELR